MGHHKRKRPKNRRAGCLLCKPWKMNGGSRSRERFFSSRLKRLPKRKDVEEQLEKGKPVIGRICKIYQVCEHPAHCDKKDECWDKDLLA